MNSLTHRFNSLITIFTFVTAAFLLPGCGAKTCSPTDPKACGGGSVETCEAATKTCVANPRCTKDADCAGGYTCTLGYCDLNCALGLSPDDTFCKAGYKCQADASCQQISSLMSCEPGSSEACNGPICDPYLRSCAPSRAKPCSTFEDPVCGRYTCDIFGKSVCQLSCSSSFDCQQGRTCLSDHTCL